jgi:hypothetical protein
MKVKVCKVKSCRWCGRESCYKDFKNGVCPTCGNKKTLKGLSDKYCWGITKGGEIIESN